ncbi:beta strand repeat-containing protein [Pseudomonas sp. XS1P51]
MSNVRSNRTSRQRLPRLKPLSHAVLCAIYSLAPLPALALDSNALPTNGQVVAGSATVSSNGNVMNVNQGSDRAIITWNTFNIGSGAQVNFYQPGTSSVALNRVTGSDGSQILGQLNANGQVFLINPSGVLFGAGSMVNVGGLVASSLDISSSDFLAGRNVFSGKSQGAVINQGVITAGDGGSVALLGAQVRNEGTEVARLGSVVLGGGEKITLDLNGDGLINLEVNDPAIGASVVNRGLLQANGGLVALSARDSQAMLSNVVNNEGVIEARSLQQRNGRIVLDGGSHGVVVNSGTLDVSGRNSGERGGNVSMTGEYVGLFDSGRINADGDVAGGTVLLGGDYQGSNGVHQATSTFVGSDARISADALSNGNGGKVILWSLDSTQFHGGISVKGAGSQGRGGLVETSGHALEVTGIVDLSAVSGKGGTWLIDPFNINITAPASAGGATSTSPFTSSGASSSNLSSAVLNASLSEGANVIVQTTSVGGTSGDINVLDNVKGVGNATLTLQAHRNIVMTNTSISNGNGKTLNVSLYSNYNNTGNGSVALSNATISTNGGNLTISGAVQPNQSWASTNVSNGNGISLSNGTRITTSGGNVTLRGATSSTLAAGSTATAVNIRGSSIDAGGGNISITALQASTSGTGDAFVLTAGSSLLTTGIGSITVDSTNLGSGNATRIFSTNNSIAATGSGDVTLRGNASSGYGVLVCATGASSTQSLSVGTGTLTVQGNSATGRGVYLAASGDGAVNLSSAQGGDIVLDGHSNASYGTILNSTGATSSINLTTDGNITLSGTTEGGTTPALALIASGSGTATTPGAGINIASSSGDVLLKANHNTVSTSSGSFKALSLDAGGDYSTIRVSTQTGNLTLDGTSVSGRGVDIAPSGANASIDLSTGSGDINIIGKSTTSFGGYGIFFNSTGNSKGVNVSSGSGDITLRGDSVGTSDAIALGGSTGKGVSSNRITSQGGDITLIGNFHSPNSAELDHGIAILAVNNILQTTGDGNLTLIGNATDAGSGVEVYGNGKAQLSVENGALSITGRSGAGDGIGLLTGQNVIQATGTGSVALTGQSRGGVGLNIYPSGSSSSLTLSTVSGDLSLTGTSAATSSGAGLSIRSGASGPANGVKILSGSGDIRLSGTAQGSGDGIAFSASSANGYNSVATGADGNLSLIGRSASGAALSFDDGNNNLQVADGLLLVDVDTPTGNYITHTDDTTNLSASGSGAVVISRGGLVNSSLFDVATAPTTQYMQMQMAQGVWSQPLNPDYHLTAMGSVADQVNIDVAQWPDIAAADTAGPRSSSKTERE